MSLVMTSSSALDSPWGDRWSVSLIANTRMTGAVKCVDIALVAVG